MGATGMALSSIVFLLGLVVAGASSGQQRETSAPASTVQSASERASPPVTIKVQAPSVVVDVIVTDKKGRHVGDLAASDFAVSDNGIPQKIVTFVPPIGAVLHPLPSVPAGPGGTNQPAQVPSPTPLRQPIDLASVRFITLVLDLGDLQPGSLENARRAAIQYLQKTVAKEDFVAVYRIDHTLHLDAPFTQDKQRAIEAIRRSGHRAPSGAMSADERIEIEQQIRALESQAYGFGSGAGSAAGAFAPQQISSLRAYLWTQSIFQAKGVFVALRAIAQAYRDLPGRKNVVVFSEGFIRSPEAKPEMAAVIDMANRANVAFYIVDASGLTADFDAASDVLEDLSGIREALLASQEGAGAWYGYSEFDHLERLGGRDMLHDDLGQVAQATGGFYIKNQNDLLHGLELADRDLRDFYTLVYQPSNIRYDGSFHKIKVDVLTSGYSVRFRRGYWAIPPGQELMMTPAAAQLLAALGSGSLRSAFSPSLNAALLLGGDGKLSVPAQVLLPGRSVKFDRDGQTSRAGLTLLLVARDADGHPVAVHQRFLTLRLDDRQRHDFEMKNLEINARLAVPRLEPLEVQAIVQLPDGAVAVGHRKLAIATPRPLVPAVTSVLLSNFIEPGKGAADPSDPLRGEDFQLRLSPPRFSPSDKLTAYFGVLLDSTLPETPAPRLRVAYSIESSARAAKVFPPEDVSVSASQSLVRVLKQFDLTDLPAGHYTFQVSVKDLANGESASQRCEFDVR
jgi:VWFA-related protein